jgi:TusA-related sulfurtransferase
MIDILCIKRIIASVKPGMAQMLLYSRSIPITNGENNYLVEKADVIIDFRGSISSISLLKATQVFQRMKPLEIMEIRGSDPDTRRDLLKVLPKSSYEVITMDTGDETMEHQVRIRKRS